MIVNGKEVDENTLEAKKAKRDALRRKTMGERLYGEKDKAEQDKIRMDQGL